MRRLKKIALWLLAAIVAVPVVVVLAIFIFANTGPGQRLIESQASSLTGGRVSLSGLSGRFPDALRLAHVELHDKAGVWLSADDIVIDWSPTALLGMAAKVQLLSAGDLNVTRLPLPNGPPAAASGGGFSLPVSVDLERLTVGRLELGAPVAGVAAALKVDGAAHVISLQRGAVTLDATRLDSDGAYHVQASLAPDAINATLTAQEPQGGLIAALAKLPAIGALNIAASVSGPQTAERATITAAAGPLRLNLAGTVNIPGKTVSADLTAKAPAMQPRQDISWNGIDITAHVTGPFTAPNATAHVAVDDVKAAGASVQSVRADVNGTRGEVELHAIISGTHLPGAQANLFAASPIDLTGDVNLQAKERPAHFQLTHKLLSVKGDAQTAGDLIANITASVPDIAPLAATAGADIRGSLNTTVHAAGYGAVTDITADGKANITGGQAPVPGLLGPATFNAALTLTGQDVAVRTVSLNGRALHADISGAERNQALDFDWSIKLPDLSVLNPQSKGDLTATGHVGGKLDAIALNAKIAGQAGNGQFAKAPVDITLSADHLPAAPNADLRAQLRLAGAPLVVVARTRTEAGGVLHTVLQQADWKSFTASADVSLAKGAEVPVGKLNISITRLADISQFIGTETAGSLKTVLTSAPDNATVDVQGRDLANGPRRIASLSLTGRAAGAIKDPDLTASLALNGIDAQGVTGQSHVTLRGKAAALTIGATAQLQNLQGAPANLSLAALLNGRSKQATLHNLTGDWKTLALRQQGPALIDFGQKIAVDRLHLTVNQASLSLAGQVSPTLALTAAVRNVTPDLAKPVMPSLAAAGTVSADARLTGTPAAPQGSVHLTAAGLRMKTGPGASLPPAQITAAANLDGRAAHIDIRVNAGPKLTMAVNGMAPLQPTGALALQTSGHLDLALLAPILEAGGRRASGQAAIDIATSGTPQAPRLSGSITLANAELQDFTQGLHLTKIGARIDAAGDTLTISRFHATAGPGSIELSGTIGAFAPGLPVDLHVTARQARPLASDLLTALFDADLTVQGHAAGEMDAKGKIVLHHVDINIPDGLPPSVAVLNVRRPGDKPPPPPSAAAPPPAFVRLNIVVDAPSNIFVRGKGLDAELGGTLTIAGTSVAPRIEGGFEMRRGDFSLAGTTLNFTKGSVGFNGASSLGKIDPTLDFQADSSSGGYTATLHVTGYADAPKIALSSVPDLPQDEILAHLLFGTSMKNLSPFQIAEIGAALAELSGLTGSGGPLGSLRKGLGLDRLSVGGGSNGAGPSVEAGKYVAKGVYVGAKQSTGGAGGTQALVQIDLTRHLKLNTTLGTGGGTAQGATPDNDPGSSIGLSYGFEY